MRVLFSDPFVESGQFDTPGEKVELPQLLRESDFVCIHAPLLPQTRHMIGADAFAQMKDTAVLINCSRGPIVDTDALVKALDDQSIAGCALDVFEVEPLPESHRLWGMENVILTPHIAVAEAEDVGERTVSLFLDNATRLSSGEPLRNVVDKTMWF